MPAALTRFLHKLPGMHISSTQKMFFVQQLQIMVRAGVPLTKALATLADQANNNYAKKVLAEVREGVQKGKPLADALREYESDFGELMINMIEAGEASGRLDEVLEQVYVQMKKDHEVVAKVRGALTYPAIVVVAMAGIGTFMIVFVIPKLTAIFKESDLELPLPTKILIAVSDFITQNGALSAVLAIGGITLFWWVIHTSWGQPVWHALLLRTPVAGKIIRKVNMARFSRTVSSFLKTDIPIVKTLQTTAKVLGNVHYRRALLESADQITKGIGLAQSLEPHQRLFNATLLQMISVGEESGSLDTMLSEAAGFYEADVNETMTTLPSLLEPILMVFLGVGVGGMAVAIILPLYSLTQAI